MGAEQSNNRLDKITVVNSAANVVSYDTEKDEHILKLASMARFHPILRSCLHQSPPLTDDPMVRSAINAKPLVDMVERMQEHMIGQAQIVAYDQNRIAKRCHEVDHRVSQMTRRIGEHKRRLEQCHTNIQKVESLQAIVGTCTRQIRQIVTAVHELNAALPLDLRLPPLDLNMSVRIPPMENVTFRDTLRLQSPELEEAVEEMPVVDQ